jgi:hypothetical protein
MPAEHDDVERLLDAALEQTPRNEPPPTLKN